MLPRAIRNGVGLGRLCLHGWEVWASCSHCPISRSPVCDAHSEAGGAPVGSGRCWVLKPTSDHAECVNVYVYVWPCTHADNTRNLMFSFVQVRRLAQIPSQTNDEQSV